MKFDEDELLECPGSLNGQTIPDNPECRCIVNKFYDLLQEYIPEQAKEILYRASQELTSEGKQSKVLDSFLLGISKGY